MKATPDARPSAFDLDAADERVGAKREASSGEGLRKDGVDGRGNRADFAPVHAVPAVVARHALAARLTDEQRLAHRDQIDPEAAAGAAAQLLGTAERRRRRVEVTVRQHRQPFAGADDANQAFGFAVERRQLLVGQRPVRLDAVERSFAEVVFGKPQCDAVPVQASAAQHANPISADPIAFVADVGLDPIRVEHRLLLGPRAAVPELVGPLVPGELTGRHLAAGFEQQHARASPRQLAGSRGSGRTAADDDSVVGLGAFQEHGRTIIVDVRLRAARFGETDFASSASLLRGQAEGLA